MRHLYCRGCRYKIYTPSTQILSSTRQRNECRIRKREFDRWVERTRRSTEIVDDVFETVSFVCGVLVDKSQYGARLKGDSNENEFPVDLIYDFCGEEVVGCEGEGCGC